MARTTTFFCDRCKEEIPKVLLDGYDEPVSQRASVAISTKPSYEVRVDADLCLPCGEVVAQAVLHLLEGTTPLERDGADEREERFAGLVAGGDGAARFVAVSSEPRPEHHRPADDDGFDPLGGGPPHPACEQDVVPPKRDITDAFRSDEAMQAFGVLRRTQTRDVREDVVGGDVTEGGTR